LFDEGRVPWHRLSVRKRSTDITFAAEKLNGVAKLTN
jgi:hypothetical protein